MKVAVLIAPLLFNLPAIADDTLGCGSKIVHTGMSTEEVKRYCGNPSLTAVEEQDVHAGARVIGNSTRLKNCAVADQGTRFRTIGLGFCLGHSSGARS